MIRRRLPEKLVESLKASPFWQKICDDSELQPEIRDQKLTVYYQSQALLREIKLDRKRGVTCCISTEYVPLGAQAKSLLLQHEEGQGMVIAKGDPRAVPIGNADKSTIKKYKRRIRQLLQSDNEGRVVQAICVESGNEILDQEIAFQSSAKDSPDSKRKKIDICCRELASGNLAFVEVKQKADSRLFEKHGSAEPPEVLRQLKEYHECIKNNVDALVKVYREVLRLKIALGLGGRFQQLSKHGFDSVIKMPVLVIGNCTAGEVRRILGGKKEWKPLLDRLPEVASALIVCKKNEGCRIDLKPNTQTTLVFKASRQ